MSQLRISALSNRSLSFVHSPDKTQFTLPAPQDWTLSASGDVRRGTTGRTVTTLHGLSPDTDYLLTVAGQELAFRTPICGGETTATLTPDQDNAEVAAANAAVLQAAIDNLPRHGTLTIPRGTWFCAPIRLRSEMTLNLAASATLAAPSDRSGWPIIPAHDTTGRMLGSWEGLPAVCFAAPVHAIGATNLTIAGPGTLDGGGDRGDWWTWPKETRDGARRPRGLHLIDCSDVTLQGFTIRNAPSWTVHPQGCRTRPPPACISSHRTTAPTPTASTPRCAAMS